MEDTARNNPQVSIGMPVYNGEKYIREALNSLLAQSFTDFELIISDNASLDKTELICREYLQKDSRIQYIRQEKNLGASNNFEFVLNKAKGKYFMWAAHDDVFFPFHLEKLLNLHFSGDFVLVASQPVYIEIKTKRRFYLHKIPSSIFSSDKKNTFLQYMSLHHWDYGKATVIYGLYKKDKMPCKIFLQGLGDELADVGSDLIFLYRNILIGQILYCEDVTWERGERFYQNINHGRSKIYVTIRKILYYILKKIYKTKNVNNIIMYCDVLKKMYSDHFLVDCYFLRNLKKCEYEIAGLIMPIKFW